MESNAAAVEAIRKASEAFAGTLSAVMKIVEGLPRLGGEEHRQLVEQWLGVARFAKNNVIAATEQGFGLWERECRRVLGAPHGAEPWAMPPNPIEAWAESWKRAVETFGGLGKPADAWNEAARKQLELVQQNLQEGLRAWQRLWQRPGPEP